MTMMMTCCVLCTSSVCLGLLIFVSKFHRNLSQNLCCSAGGWDFLAVEDKARGLVECAKRPQHGRLFSFLIV